MDPREYGQQQHHLQQPERQHQRFSWQVPLNAPPEGAASPHQRARQQQQPVNTDVNSRSRAFSYAQTPIEHRAPNFSSSPNVPPLPRTQTQSPTTPIDERPQSFYNPHIHPTQPRPQSTYLSTPTHTNEKVSFSPVSPQESTLPPLVSPISPIVQPPSVQTQQPLDRHASQRNNLSRLNTKVGHNMPPIPPTPQSYQTQADPLPQKLPITPISPDPIKKGHEQPPHVRSKSYAAEPYSPHSFSSPPTHAVFSPHSAHGPNGLDFALHQPGQIAHPNMDLSAKGTSHEWKHSLCGCSGDVGTCMTGIFCPCILYGRTAYRMNQKSEKKDPTNMLEYSATNGHCMLMSVSCGLWWLFPMIQRTRLRHLYKLTGSLGSDIVKACCCCCCVAIQNEREVRDREESARRWAGPASTQVYTAPSQMVYSPQR